MAQRAQYCFWAWDVVSSTQKNFGARDAVRRFFKRWKQSWSAQKQYWAHWTIVYYVYTIPINVTSHCRTDYEHVYWTNEIARILLRILWTFSFCSTLGKKFLIYLWENRVFVILGLIVAWFDFSVYWQLFLHKGMSEVFFCDQLVNFGRKRAYLLPSLADRQI